MRICVICGFDSPVERDASGNVVAGRTDDAGTLLSHGSRATMTTPAGTQTYGYDEAGRMTSLQYGLGTASWQYQDNNLLWRQALPNGCYTDYGYNAANQLTDLVNKTSGGSTLSGYLDFLYLGTGDLATVTSSIPGSTSLQGQVDYGYDHKRQLTLEDSDRNGGYSDANVFDGAGNATTFRNASKTYNADNQLTGPGTYVYDGNGNPTTWSGTSLTFDVENRLTGYGTALTAGYRGDGLRAGPGGTR